MLFYIWWTCSFCGLQQLLEWMCWRALEQIQQIIPQTKIIRPLKLNNNLIKCPIPRSCGSFRGRNHGQTKFLFILEPRLGNQASNRRQNIYAATTCMLYGLHQSQMLKHMHKNTPIVKAQNTDNCSWRKSTLPKVLLLSLPAFSYFFPGACFSRL